MSFDNPKKNLVLTGDIEADASDSPRVDHNPDDIKDNGKVSAQASPRIGTHGASQESGIHPKSDVTEGCLLTLENFGFMPKQFTVFPYGIGK